MKTLDPAVEVLSHRSVDGLVAVPHPNRVPPELRLAVRGLVKERLLRFSRKARCTWRQAEVIPCDVYELTPEGLAHCTRLGIGWR